jgi:multiple sugar transport system permease protein
VSLEVVSRTDSRRRRGNRANLAHVPLVVGVLVILAPFLWFVSVAIRPNSQLYQLWPSSITFVHFKEMLSRVPEMVSYYEDSLVITGVTVALVVIIGTLAGYAFSRLEFPGRDIIFWAVVLTTFIPPATAIASLYGELANFNLLDSRTGLILVYTAWDLGIASFIMRSVFASIPRELDEAATIDGASRWRILWRLLVPLSAGGMVVVALLSFTYVWGEYMFAFTFAGDHVRPMSVGIQLFQPTADDPHYSFNVAAAAALVMFLPSIVIYIGFQKWFTKGLMEGALKG